MSLNVIVRGGIATLFVAVGASPGFQHAHEDVGMSTIPDVGRASSRSPWRKCLSDNVLRRWFFARQGCGGEGEPVY